MGMSWSVYLMVEEPFQVRYGEIKEKKRKKVKEDEDKGSVDGLTLEACRRPI